MAGELEARGVDVSRLVWREDAATGVSVILSSPADRGIYTAPGTIATLEAREVEGSLVAAARHVHVSSFFLQRALRADLGALLERARRDGAGTSLDPTGIRRSGGTTDSSRSSSTSTSSFRTKPRRRGSRGPATSRRRPVGSPSARVSSS
jgi:hypothetical protein